MKTVLLVIVSIILFGFGTAFWSLGTYNRLVDKDETVSAAWAQVQNAYQRRADLIPNLVETVKGAAKFERDTLREVAQARAAATGITLKSEDLGDEAKLAAFDKAQSSFSGALGRLLVSLEKYPDLKATENFRDLQGQLQQTEDEIAVGRHNFNEVAASYNAYLRMVPASLIARRGGFKSRAYFKSEDGAERAPKVKF